MANIGVYLFLLIHQLVTAPILQSNVLNSPPLKFRIITPTEIDEIINHAGKGVGGAALRTAELSQHKIANSIGLPVHTAGRGRLPIVLALPTTEARL